MHRAQPVASKLLAKKWNDRAHEIHRKKLKAIKADVDNGRPKEYPHLHLKLKKLQVEEERLSQIEKDNRRLLEKMSNIMRQKSSYQNQQWEKKSLNRELRRRELQKITEENQSLLRRIQTSKPVYNHIEWEQERSQNEKYLENICEYQYQGPQSRARFEELDDEELMELERQRKEDEDRRIKEIVASRPKKASTYHQKRRSQSAPREDGDTERDNVPGVDVSYSDENGEYYDQGENRARGLAVTIVEAADLRAGDGGAKVNPFVVMTSGSLKEQTTVEDRTVHPKWNQSFEFEGLQSGDRITFEVIDHDTFGDNLLGEVTVEVNLENPYDVWLPLALAEEQGKEQGELFVQMTALE